MGTRSIHSSPSLLQPCCRVGHNVNQAIPNNAITTVAFNWEAHATHFDPFGMHDTIVNNSRITFNVAGKYLVGCHIAWAANVNGVRMIQIRLNGGVILARYYSDTSELAAWAPRDQLITTLYNAGFNDFVEVQGYQNSGGALNILGGGAYSPVFWAHRLS